MSHVDALRVELNSIADAYLELQRNIDQASFNAKGLQERWSNTGLTPATQYFDMVNGEIQEFHRMYESIGSWAFNISAQMAGIARRL